MEPAGRRSRHRADLLGGLTVLEGRAQARSADGAAKEQAFVAVPYYAWAHRGEGEMAVWLPRRPGLESPAP